MPTVPAQIFDGRNIPSFVYSDNVSVIDYQDPYSPYTEYWSFSPTVKVAAFLRPSVSTPYTVLIASSGPPPVIGIGTPRGNLSVNQQFYINGQTVYYRAVGIWAQANMPFTVNQFELVTDGGGVLQPVSQMAWLMVYGDNIPDGYNVTYDLQGCTGGGLNPSIIPLNATITNFDFIPDTDYSFVFNSAYIDGDGFPSGTPINYDWDPDTGHLKIGPVTSDITVHVHAYIDPYSDLPVDGETDIPGGDIIGIPSLPGLGAVSAGVIGLFAPSPSQMQSLANYMWSDFGGTGTTVEDILTEIVEALKRAIANPLDYVVGLNIIPSQGLSIGSDRTIRFGFTNSGVSMPQLTSQYFVVDCGTLRFDTLCGDTFLDYAPYSKFSIYLPYVGIKEVDANDFVGHTIGVVYHGDVVTGGITAYITKDGSVMYQYSGCCALNVPLSSDGWGSTIAGAVQIATSMVAGGFAGGAAGVAESAVKGAAAAAANPSLLSPKVQHSGAVSGGAGCMGIQTPFVIREAVRFHSTAGMNSVSGYPSFYYKSLGSVSGYTVVLDVHLKGIPATSEEIAEIESLLKSGVVL